MCWSPCSPPTPAAPQEARVADTPRGSAQAGPHGDELAEGPVGWRFKALPPQAAPYLSAQIPSQGYRLFEDGSLRTARRPSPPGCMRTRKPSAHGPSLSPHPTRPACSAPEEPGASITPTHWCTRDSPAGYSARWQPILSSGSRRTSTASRASASSAPPWTRTGHRFPYSWNSGTRAAVPAAAPLSRCWPSHRQPPPKPPSGRRRRRVRGQRQSRPHPRSSRRGHRVPAHRP